MATVPLVRTLHDLLIARLGVANIEERINRDANDIDIADKIIMRADPNRVAAVIVNLGTGTCYLRPSGVASSSVGIILIANGGSLAMNWQDDLSMQTLEWHGAASADNQSILVLELVLI